MTADTALDVIDPMLPAKFALVTSMRFIGFALELGLIGRLVYLFECTFVVSFTVFAAVI